jgi:uncharacterized protein
LSNCAHSTPQEIKLKWKMARDTMGQMKVLVSGSHGLVGKALVASLIKDGHEVLYLVRREHQFGSPEIEWHPENGEIDAQHLEGLSAVVHLAGESIAAGRWTDEKKRRIRSSRIAGTQLLANTLINLKHPPQSFLSASAIGYYGNRGDEVLTEASSAGNEFLADVCREWEQATEPAAEKGIQVVNLRFGIILSGRGGALARMVTPFRMGVGGRVGSGEQWMSWIALHDVVSAIKFALTNNSITGPVNIVSPNPVTNADFTSELGKALSRPTIFPMPAFGVRLAFGEMGDALLLSSQRVIPEKLSNAGFVFAHPQLEEALRTALKH